MCLRRAIMFMTYMTTLEKYRSLYRDIERYIERNPDSKCEVYYGNKGRSHTSKRWLDEVNDWINVTEHESARPLNQNDLNYLNEIWKIVRL